MTREQKIDWPRLALETYKRRSSAPETDTINWKRSECMRIAISAESNTGLDSPISPHFGRCPYFILVDVEGQEIKGVISIDNPFYGNHAPGQVPAFISSQRADVMLTGGMGVRAVGFFQQYNIEAVTGASGTVRQSLQSYLAGELHGVDPCAESAGHHHYDD
jgi:predicted Fe-Mo cluster-binding NifX family protein